MVFALSKQLGYLRDMKANGHFLWGWIDKPAFCSKLEYKVGLRGDKILACQRTGLSETADLLCTGVSQDAPLMGNPCCPKKRLP